MLISQYELQRAKNIAKNRDLLESLVKPSEIAIKARAPKVKAPKPTPKPSAKKRKNDAESESDASKKARVEPEETPNLEAETIEKEVEDDTGPRRSDRNRGKKIDYTKPVVKELPKTKTRDDDDRLAASENAGNMLGKRLHNPKTFGHIPGIEVGTWWKLRAHCSTDAVHAPFVAGISGDSKKGAYSVALSGGYDDDVDLGYAFTFTGSGGRDLKGTASKPKNLRTAPQSSDQSFENPFNKSLQVSAKTKKPVRVIRGYKLKSKFAPFEGFRYDGLYVVEKAWMEAGLNDGGFMVCKYAFKRLPGQPPLPEREEEPESGDEEDETESNVEAEPAE